MIGLKRGIVRLEPYNVEWKKIYKTEAKLLQKTIGKYVLDIQHVGSTSIPGLDSKPVIDIAVAVKHLEDGEKCIKPLSNIDYEYKHDAGIFGRHFFVKGNEECQTHFLHIEELNSELWLNHILFREYLLEHSKERQKYTELKRKLEKKFANNRNAYTKGKEQFIKTILKKALKKL